MIVKTLIKVVRAKCTNQVRISTKTKYRKVPSGNHRAEKYNKWTERFNRTIQHQSRSSGRNNQWTQKQGSGIHSIRTIQRK